MSGPDTSEPTVAGTSPTCTGVPATKNTSFAGTCTPGPGQDPGWHPARAPSSCATSGPDMPGPRSRYIGASPCSASTGRPEIVASTPPSWITAFGAGRLVMTAPELKLLEGSVTGRGDPNPPVPRARTTV